MSVAAKRRKRRLILVASALAVALGLGALYLARRVVRDREYAAMRRDGMATAQQLIAELTPLIEHEKRMLPASSRESAIVSLPRHKVSEATAVKFDQTLEKLSQYLARYRDTDAQNVEVLGTLGQLRPMLANRAGGAPSHLTDAIGALRRLVAVAPERWDQRRVLLRLFSAARYRVEALDTADKLLAKDPDDLEAIKARVQALTDLQRLADAIKADELWRKLSPGDIEAHLHGLVIRARMHEPGTMLQQAAARFPADRPRPSDVGHHLLGAFAAAVSRDSEGARVRLNRMLDVMALDRTFVTVPWLRHAASRTQLDDIFIANAARQLDAAEMFAESLALLRRSKGEASRRILLARLWESDRRQQMLDMLGPFDPAKAGNYDTDLLGMWAIALSDLKQADAAKKVRGALAARTSDARAAAWAAVAQWAAGGTTVEPRNIIAVCRAAVPPRPPRYAAPVGPGGHLDLYLGDAFAQLGEGSQAVPCWTSARDQRYAWSAPYLRIAQTFLWSNPQLSAEAADAALRRVPNLRAARVYGACARSITAMRIMPRDTVAMGVALDAVEKLAAEYPDESRLFDFRIRLNATMGRSDATRRLLQNYLDTTDKPAEADLMRLAELSRELKLGLEQACLSQAERIYGLSAQSAFLRAAALVTENHADAGMALFDQAVMRAKGDLTPWKLGRAQLLDLCGDGRANEARAAWKALAPACPSLLHVQQLALRSPSTKGEREFQEQTIQRIRAIAGEEAVLWRLDRARWLLETRPSDQQLTEASALLAEVTKKAPDLTDAQMLLAQCQLYQRNTKAAIAQLASTASRNPNSASIALDYARLLWADRQAERAKEELLRIRTMPLTSDQRRVAAELFFQLNLSDEGLALIRPMTNAATSQPVIDLLQARLYHRSHQYARVQEILEKLLKQGTPDLPTITFAAEFYASTGRGAEAQRILKLLDDLKLPEGAKEYALAEYATRHADPVEALGRLHAATRAGSQNPMAWRLLILWHMLRGEGDEAAAAARAAAKALPVHPVFAAVVQHAEVIKTAVMTPEFQPLAVTILEDAEHRSAVVEILRLLVDAAKQRTPMVQVMPKLRQYAEAYPRFGPLQFYVAAQFLALREFDEAMAFAGRAAQRFPTSPDPARIVTLALAGAGRWDQVPVAAQRWRERTGENTLVPDALEAQAYVRLGRSADALPLLSPHLKHALTQPRLYAGVVGLYSTAIVSADRLDLADAVLPLLRVQNDFAMASIVPSVENSRRLATVEEWLKQVALAVSREDARVQLAVAEAWAIAGRRFRSPELAENARKVLADLKQRYGLEPMTRLRIAELYERMGDGKSAEELYRYHLALLARTPEEQDLRHAVANNLVMILTSPERSGAAELKESLALMNSVIAARPQASTFYDTRALVYQRLRDYPQAVQDSQKAIDLAPAEPEGYMRMAEICWEMGEKEKARASLLQVMACVKNDQMQPIFSGRVAALKAKLGLPSTMPAPTTRR